MFVERANKTDRPERMGIFPEQTQVEATSGVGEDLPNVSGRLIAAPN